MVFGKAGEVVLKLSHFPCEFIFGGSLFTCYNFMLKDHQRISAALH